MGEAAGVVKIFAVIVVYKMQPADSPSLRTLLAAAKEVAPSVLELRIFIQDNSAEGQSAPRLPPQVEYEAGSQNPGLSAAYNRALTLAVNGGFEWLLTLDQDTTLAPNYLQRMMGYIQSIRTDLSVAAVVPRVMDGQKNVSPFRFVGGAIPRWFDSRYAGIPAVATYALNSAAMLRVAGLIAVGGYDLRFPLDISDIDLFHRLHGAGARVLVAGDIMVDHNFSLLDKGRRMSAQRYRSMLFDECAFWDMHMGWLARCERFIRLLGRTCRESLKSDQRQFRTVGFNELRRRLMRSKSWRIAEWTEWSNARQRRNAAPAIPGETEARKGFEL